MMLGLFGYVSTMRFGYSWDDFGMNVGYCSDNCGMTLGCLYDVSSMFLGCLWDDLLEILRYSTFEIFWKTNDGTSVFFGGGS